MSTPTGEDLPWATVAFDYPAGALSDDFTPPYWTEPARAHPCRARLVLTVPTLGPAMVPLDWAGAAETARADYSRLGRPHGSLPVRWIAGRTRLGDARLVQFSVTIASPPLLRPQGAVIAIGMLGDAFRRGTVDGACATRRLETAALRRASAAARRFVRGFDLSLSR